MNFSHVNILVGCEESQAITLAFRSLGFSAYSCDIVECSGGFPEFHLKMDVFDALKLKKWDLVILHPPCTYTCVSGNRWYYNSHLRLEGVQFCVDLWNAAKAVCPRVLLEQPKTVISRYLGKCSQVIHPWQFGHGETKETWLWLHGLPLLSPTCVVDGREQRIWKMSSNVDRRKERSKTYVGIASAIADQYSLLFI